MRSITLVLCLAVGVAGHSAGQGEPSRPPSLPELEAAVRADTNDSQLYYQLAMAYFDRKKWDQAQGALQTAITIAPGYADAFLALAILTIRRGEGYWESRVKAVGLDSVLSEFRRAKFCFRRAFLLNPLVELKVLGKSDGVEFSIEVSSDGQLVQIPDPPWWAGKLTKAVNEFRDGRYEKASARLQELRTDKRFGGSDENTPGAVLWYQGLAAAHLEQFDVAIRNFSVLTFRAYADEQLRVGTSNGASAVPMRSNDYRFVLATMLSLGGRYRDAVPAFRTVLEFDLGSYMAHVQMARMFEAQGCLEEALKERRLALDANPDDPDLLIDLGGTLLRAGRPVEAEAPIQQAGRINPRDARAPYLEGLVEEVLQKPVAQREAFERFLAIAPSRLGPMKQDARERLSRLP